MPRTSAASHHDGMITDHVKLPGAVTGVLERPGARLVYEVAGDGAAVLARRIPGATYHVVAGAGHMVNMEQPAAINDLLISLSLEASWIR
jgi:pimeloyl-ACP methyl ester carboxylesterase